MKFAKTPLMVAGAFVVAMATPTPLLAASASDTFTVSLELKDLLEVSCTDFNFGTLYRSSAQTANVVVRVTGTTITFENEGITGGSSASGTQCTIKGLGVAGFSTMSFSGGAQGVTTPGTTADGFPKIDTIPLINGESTPLYANLQIVTSGNGNGTYDIKGAISIPSSAALGTYTSAPITLTVTE